MESVYPGAGKPPALTNELDELLVITYSALESVNVERWALENGATAPPPIPGTLRDTSYETDVVGNIHRIGQRYWRTRGEAVVWERPILSGVKGRPPTVDLALFNAGTNTETRIEFGLYTETKTHKMTAKKLTEDAKGLQSMATSTDPSYGNVNNFIVHWHRVRGSAKTLAMTALA